MKLTAIAVLVTLQSLAFGETAPTISAQLEGENYGKVSKTIVVTAEKQKIFHFHSDFEGGGTWYDAFISVDDRWVTILERDSISTPYKTGNKVKTVEHVYSLPVQKIAGDEVQLRNGNRVVLTKREQVRSTKQDKPSK